MVNDATVAGLMWIGVGVGYALSVWKLHRLCRRAARDDSARGEVTIALRRAAAVKAARWGVNTC